DFCPLFKVFKNQLDILSHNLMTDWNFAHRLANLDNHGNEKMDLNHLGEQWLYVKIQRMRNLLKIAEPDEALYREIMLSLGYPKNKIQFLELALLLPFRVIKDLKEEEKIKTALLYRAGFSDVKKGLPEDFDFSLRMDKSVWEFKKIRPANFPNKRIIKISQFLSEMTSTGLVKFFVEKIKKEMKNLKNPKEAKECVIRIMDIKGIGIDRKREMFFNIIMPFTMAYLENKEPETIEFLNRIFELHPPLSENTTTRKFKKLVGEKTYLKINSSAKTYFGIHHYIKNTQN
ncbi:MAG: DUF2851 family protein, partial [Candidatus Kryptonium sp.]|nr:DUF2851 family protein [Candidatus Kryptonium sp.]